MKLLIQNNRIAGTATDDYTGPDEFIDAPEDFDESRMSDYVYASGVLIYPEPLGLPSISPRQIRQTLTLAGLRASVESAVAAGDQDLKDWWEFSTAFERANPQVIGMAAAMGVTDADLDGLWTLGATL